VRGRERDNLAAGNAEFDRAYREGSARLRNEGLIGVRYRVPKGVSMLLERLRGEGPLEVLELGAGVGEAARLIRRSGLNVKRYVAVELSYHGARRVRSRGFPAAQMDAQRLGFADNSFDLVFCFDVMHHVLRPRAMAQEMRVTRNHLLLSEPNHLSWVRRLGEIHPGARSRGERSYTPEGYRAFFTRGPYAGELAELHIEPYYVLVPPKAPRALIPYIVRVSEMGQRVPGLRWIGQSLLIHGRKRQPQEAPSPAVTATRAAGVAARGAATRPAGGAAVPAAARLSST
jgi:SAM-dependent methyltransferase